MSRKMNKTDRNICYYSELKQPFPLWFSRPSNHWAT